MKLRIFLTILSILFYIPFPTLQAFSSPLAPFIAPFSLNQTQPQSQTNAQAPLKTSLSVSQSAVPLSASTASDSYACILSNAFFYAARDEKRGLFLIPKTYFVKILEFGNDFCKIEYLFNDAHTKAIQGYAKTQDLTFVDYTPETPYLYHLFTLSYRIEDSPDLSGGFLTQLSVTCAYYGDFSVGSETYCYVLRGEDFGYVPKPATLSYPENPEYENRLPKEEQTQTPPSEEVDSTPKSSPAQIALLIALCILIPLLAALILKPPRKPPFLDEEN